MNDDSPDDPDTPATRTATGDDVPPAHRPAPAAGAPPLSQHHDPDRYEIIGEHGRGGLGRVTRVHDRNLGRDIAIKELIAHSELAELRFQREALITARLEHPGIVPIHEAGRWPDGTPFYAMKLVAGRPLRALIAEHTSVEDRLGLLHHVIAVADAIAYAHGRGIIHRDLKPANVIVGDFGETVVIDWGLAKDLGAADDLPGGTPSPSPDSPDSPEIGLTSAGSVLGTPAYMAPEQARGEPVDQRADVFAIGAMLWELCSLAKVPPSDHRLRDRMLRRAGIDRDLIAIIDKALADAPDRRYPDAGALAVDLKAFKAGARIASRDYSLFGTLAHWARRHRALAIAIAAAIITLVAGTSLYVHGIAAARNRADAFNNDLILSNAESLMQTDPTAAAALLRRYTGPDRQRLTMLDTEAQSRGASTLEIHPYSGLSLFARGLEDGSILSFGDHQQLIKTSLSGITQILATNVAAPTADFSPRRQRIAYECEHAAICLLDITSAQILAKIPLPDENRTNEHIINLIFSPNGDSLSATTLDGRVLSWNISTPLPRLRLELKLGSIAWIDHTNADTLVIFADDTTSIVTLHDDGRANITRAQVQLPKKLISAHSRGENDRDHIELAMTTGDLLVLSSATGELLARTRGCVDNSGTSAILGLAHRSGIVYSCENGTIGLWTPGHGTATLVKINTRPNKLAESDDGCCLYIGTASGDLVAYSFSTKRETIYIGQSGKMVSLQAPSRKFPYILTGDQFGYLRVRSPPPSDSSILLQSSSTLTRVYGNSVDNSIIFNGAVAGRYQHHQLDILQPHAAHHTAATLDPTRSRIALFGSDNDVEIWSLDSIPSLRVVNTETSVLAVAFTPDGRSLLVGGEDRLITRWSLTDKSQLHIATIDSSALGMRQCTKIHQVAIFGAQHDWMTSGQTLRLLGEQTSFRQAAICSPDGVWLVEALTDGTVQLRSTVSGWSFPVYQAREPARWLAMSADSEQLAITADNQVIVRAMPTTHIHDAAKSNWEARIAGARYASYSPDGAWLAVMCDNGDVWFYRRRDGRWLYRSAGTARLVGGDFSPDSTQFVTADATGGLLLFDMTASTFREAAQ